ncbi:MAG TPA: AI-2E family transporter [Alphaproteobacteria bacterium]|nr:AI-2E family transporter [Alphaproteobacteria bacterium]
MDESGFSVERFRRAFLLLLVVGISLAFLAMIQGFLTALLLAAISTALCQPLHRRLVALLRGRVALASAITLVTVLVVIIGPLLTFFGIVAAQAVEITGAVRPWVEEQVSRSREGPLAQLVELPDFLVPYEAELYARAGELATRFGQFLFDSVAAATRGTANFLFMLFIMLYAMFFFLRDGPAILDRILYYMPLESHDELRMVEKFVSVTRATLKGSLVIGVVQGALAGGAFAVIGIQGAAFWGTVMAVLSIIPGVGTALIWVPAAAWLFAEGRPGAAAGLTVWCMAVVGTADNLLRPALVGRDTQMSDLLIMLSTLGGLLLLGPVGLLIGPILAALFVTVWELYAEAFVDYLPEGRAGHPPDAEDTETRGAGVIESRDR